MDVGDKVMGYVLDRKLGEGGMGAVFHAVHPVLGQEVAVKVLDPALARNPEIRERFIQEARIQTQLMHPGIVRVLTADVEGGTLALVMEYVDGLSLDKVIAKRGALPVDDAQRVMAQVLGAVGHAHSRGVVHRDLKPANVMVQADGTVKVMDFGIAKVLGSARLTRTGTAMGSAHYMSPEQVLSRADIDHRTDIYSLGCTFYEMLTGRPPFADADQPGTDSDFLVKQAHVQREPTDIRQLRPDVPAALADAISRALAKDQDQRPARCALLAGMLGHPAALAAPGPAPTSSIAAGQRSGTSSTVAAGPLQSSSGAGHGDATAAELACPICGAHGTEMHGAKKLYDVPVCKRCRNAFANRRQGAFLLDSIGVFVVGVILLLALSGDEAGPSNTALVVCALVVNGLLVCKDGLGGRSLGKLLTGVGVIDVSTGAAGGTWASILRNSPLLVVHARNSGE